MQADCFDSNGECYFIPDYQTKKIKRKYSKERALFFSFLLDSVIDKYGNKDIIIILGVVESNSREIIKNPEGKRPILTKRDPNEIFPYESSFVAQQKHYLTVGIKPRERIGFITHCIFTFPVGKIFQQTQSCPGYINLDYIFEEKDFFLFSKEISRIGVEEECINEIIKDIDW